ncbi:DUF4169 family protein [Novosphingobium olei]|uniref:DUF4169 family protein n=1 Tax=Novosphingobium olei TaxID=2728851 RepID=A0A7Y0GA65_9SPHN|nr:DUF4169 family protein [Novosphingobium olei]NML93322.1 DUF4169 family protein [Novosphingobium olei]
MAEIVNLRAVRKAKQRAGAQAEAAANRAKFGRTAGQKALEDAEAARAAARLAGLRRERDPD